MANRSERTPWDECPAPSWVEEAALGFLERIGSPTRINDAIVRGIARIEWAAWKARCAIVDHHRESAGPYQWKCRCGKTGTGIHDMA